MVLFPRLAQVQSGQADECAYDVLGSSWATLPRRWASPAWRTGVLGFVPPGGAMSTAQG